MKNVFVLVPVLILLISCKTGCGPITPIPPSTDPTAADICGKWATLECEEAIPTEEGTPCVVWVENAMGVTGFTGDPAGDKFSRFKCIMSATTCEQSRECQ